MSTASENLNMTKKRGQKLCKKCKTPNGVRAYNCKKCDDPFPMKKPQKNKRQVITDYKTLKKVYRERYDINKFDDNHFRGLLKTKINLSDTDHLGYKLINIKLIHNIKRIKFKKEHKTYI